MSDSEERLSHTYSPKTYGNGTVSPEKHERSASCSPVRRHSRSQSSSQSPPPHRSRSSHSSSSSPSNLPSSYHRTHPDSRHNSKSPDHYKKRRSHSRSPSHSRDSHHRHHHKHRSRSPYSHGKRQSYSSYSNRHTYSNHSTPYGRPRDPGNRINNTYYEPPPSKVIGVFGLSMYTDEKELKHIFITFGPIKEIQVIYDRQTGRSRGFAFIYYDDINDAIEAKGQCDGTEIDGRRVRVDYSITKRPHNPTPGVYMGKATGSSGQYSRGDYRGRGNYRGKYNHSYNHNSRYYGNSRY